MGAMDRNTDRTTGRADRQTELELLRRHAPIIRYDSRELFFPVAVDGYIHRCSLVVNGEVVVEPGYLTPTSLTGRLPEGAHLQFVSDADRRAVVRTEARKLARQLLGPRLGRVGLFGRIVDALFLLSVFFRPTTPRLTTPVAAAKVAEGGTGSPPVVYGRVVEVANWLVLHYAYFYVMNDWRTGYRGLNDHEGDWEQVWIMCDPDTAEPIWVVASNHDYFGADLRRHWNDPELARVDGHPMLFAGAGSHALYFYPGDYVTRIEVPGLRWLFRLQRWARRALRIRDQAAERGLGPALGVPFVDAAPGDGTQHDRWELRLLDDDLPCFGQFRGLWGLDTGDPTNGERGPSGPKFDRDGQIRLSWADPVGFAGLHGSNPPSRVPSEAVLINIKATLASIDEEIGRTSRLLPLVRRADYNDEHLYESRRLSNLLRQRTELEDLTKRLERGQRVEPDIRGHLTKPAVPMAPPREAGRILAVWAASSVPLLLLAVAAVFLFDSLRVTTLLLTVAAGFSLLEQLVRRHFHAVLRLLLLYLAVATVSFLFEAVISGVLTFSVFAIGGAIAVAAVVLFVANVGELTAVQRRADVAEAVGSRVERAKGRPNS